MTQFSLPQDGTTGDGGTYTADEAALEIVRPYYTRDNPIRYGCYVNVTQKTGTILGTLLAGRMLVGSRAFILNADVAVSIPVVTYTWALVYVDNSTSSTSKSVADTNSFATFHDENGSPSIVSAYDVTYRFIRISTISDMETLHPYVYLAQTLNIDTQPRRHVSNCIAKYKDVIGSLVILVNANPSRPNMLVITGTFVVSQAGLVATTPSIYVAIDTQNASNYSRFTIDGILQSLSNNIYGVTIPLPMVSNDGGTYSKTHLQFSFTLNTFREYVYIDGEVISNKLPNAGTGVTGTAGVVSSISGMTHFVGLGEWELYTIALLGVSAAGSSLEVTYR